MLVLLVVAGLAADARPNLTGIVQDEQGRPLAKATVFIRTAAPRKGVGVL
jgi:hypothetical protein